MPGASSTSKRSIIPLFKFGEYRDHLRQIFTIAALSMLASAAETLTLVAIVPLTQAIATGNTLINRRIGPIDLAASPKRLLTIAAIGIAASLILRVVAAVLQARTITGVERRARERLVAGFAAADWPTQNGERASDLALYMQHAVAIGIRVNNMLTGLRALLSVSVMLGGALLVQYQAAIGMVLLGVALSVALRSIVRKSKAAASARTVENQRLHGLVEDLVRLSRENRIFGTTDKALVRANETIGEYIRAERRAQTLAGLVTPLYQSLGMAAALLVLGIAQAVESDSVPALGACALLLLRCLGYGQNLQNAVQKLADTAPQSQQFAEACQHYTDHALDDRGVDIDSINAIVLRSVEFKYDSSGIALSGVSLALRAGEVVGIAGPSGAGKSTLAQLLLRLRQPTGGVIGVDGRPIEAISYSSWYRHVAFVPQEIRILPGTLRENIAFRRDGITGAAIERAVQEAGLAGYVASLPAGLDTVVGILGRDVSGGQAQRIGIARALVGRPSFIVLDEPTSALDAENEAVINETLGRLASKDRIVVVIAHRESTLAVCPRLVVIQDGRVVADGPPESALAPAPASPAALVRPERPRVPQHAATSHDG